MITTAAPLESLTTKFADEDTHVQRVNEFMMESVMLRGEFNRVLVALSEVNSSVATSLASIGVLQESVEVLESTVGQEKFPPICPKLSFIQRKERQSLPPVTALSVELPGVYLEVSKSKLDALQYWIDDLSQFLERASASDDSALPPSGNTSIIGSRFFVSSRTGSTISTTTAEKSETVVKIAITEGEYTIMSSIIVHSEQGM
jgi:autophagy-related protein 2